MFGSTNPFGQSSSNPYGSPLVFGQTSSATSNPFAPKPFGSPNPFGSHTGSSLFGTSTGVFGQPSTLAFGASSAPAFGSSMPSFGASSAPTFGSSSSSFGGSSVFGQKPAFGGFGSTPGQASPFGSSFQQTQPAFGSNLFGSSSPFGASSQTAFGTTSAPAFGSTSSPAFGATSTPAFGASSTPAFGATSTPAFGSTSTPAFGSTSTPLFGNSGMAFGASSAPAFGAPSTSLFGSSSTPAFGGSSTPAFGSSTTPTFGAPSTSAFNFGSATSFGQSSPTFGSSPFGSTPSPFGSQSSPFGAQTSTPTFGSPGFGQSTFGSQAGGSRVAPYTATPEPDASGTQPAGKLESISAMPAYKDKSHEELRWEDYQRGDKGGPNPAGQPGGISFPSSTPVNPFGQTSAFGQTNAFGQTSAFGQPAANPFSSASSSNPFAPKTPAFGSTGFGSSSSSIFNPPFSSSSSSPFGSTSSTSPFGAPSVSGFGSSTSPSMFGGASTPAFGSSPSIFGSSMIGSTSSFGSGLNFGNTQSSGLFSSTPSIGQTPSPFGQSTGFQQNMPAFGSSMFNMPSTGFGGSLFNSSAPSLSNPVGFGQATPSLSTPFQSSAPSQTTSTFSFGNFGQTQTAPSGGFGSFPSTFNQGTFGQSAPIQSNFVMQPTSIANPFGTLPVMPQMSIGRVGFAPSVHYGISSMPVSEKSTPIRISSLVAPRHISQRRIRLPAWRYNPKTETERVPFFSDDDAMPATPKADAFFIPRENPRALIIRPIEQWPSRNDSDKQSIPKTGGGFPNGYGKASEVPTAPVINEPHACDPEEVPPENGHVNGHAKEQTPLKSSPHPKGVDDNHIDRDIESFLSVSGGRAGEAAISFKHGDDIETLMPKVSHSDYYTDPRIPELAAKERAEPGFCRRVKDFVVGRQGYGSIKFFGETDVRRLDVESIVQFNNREVIVYRDESKKPPVGQGLNKPAEVTLLNIKCMNKKTGQQYIAGLKVEKYQEMLMKKAQEQGAEFVSFDAVKGEWKFRVKHFSRYELISGGEDLDDVGCYEP